MDATMKVQTQIRQNAEEVSASLAKLVSWEKAIIKKDQAILSKKESRQDAPPAPVRRGAGTVATTATTATANTASAASSASSAANHTYDVGYKKWESFDVDAALQASDNDPAALPAAPHEAAAALTPTTLVPASLAASELETAQRKRTIPAARGVASTADAEAAQREIGNAEFASGNFAAAAKSYTRCLGMKSGNFVAFSNRAMAYIKLKEYHRAEADSSSALRIQPTHVKSLLRRATALNALGKHRAALRDLLQAQEAEPGSRATRGEVQRCREALLSAVARAPLVRVGVEWEGAEGGAGPDLPMPPLLMLADKSRSCDE